MLNVVVKRSRWFRGQGPDFSALRTPTGKMCCLGFASRAAGIPARKLTGVGSPAHLQTELPESLEGLIVDGYPSAKCWTLMETNDDEDIPDDARERILKEVGQRVGIAFTFVD